MSWSSGLPPLATIRKAESLASRKRMGRSGLQDTFERSLSLGFLPVRRRTLFQAVSNATPFPLPRSILTSHHAERESSARWKTFCSGKMKTRAGLGMWVTT